MLGKRLMGPGVGLTDVLRATEYVVPALEIVDARVQDPRKIFDTVADNGAAAGIVIGGRPVGPMDVDLRWVGGIMYVNSEIEETGVAAGVLGHPAMGVAWLANKLGSHGHAAGARPHRAGGLVHPRGVRRRRATRCTPTSARSAASRCSLCDRTASPLHAPVGEGRGRAGQLVCQSRGHCARPRLPATAPPARTRTSREETTPWTCRATPSSTPSPPDNCRSGCGAACAAPIAAEIVSHSGFDWLLLDTEHSPNEVPDILAQLQAVQAGTASRDRAAGVERHGADQALSRHRRADAAPAVRAERRTRRARAVESTRYPPGGVRGITGSGRASRYGRVKDYLKNASSEICVLVQVETREALEQIEAIASVDGIDGVFIGPNDLSASFGHIGNWGHPEVQAALEDAVKRLKKIGKPAGILTPERGGGEEIHRLGLHLRRGRRRSRPAGQERRRAGEKIQSVVVDRYWRPVPDRAFNRAAPLLRIALRPLDELERWNR